MDRTTTFEQTLAAASFAQLEQWARQLVDEIRCIDEQLGTRNKMDEDGRRLDGRAYWTWRHKAVHAKNTKSTQLRAVKDRLHALRMAGHADGAEQRVFVRWWPGMTRQEFLSEALRVYETRIADRQDND